MVRDWTSGAPFFVRDGTGVAIVDPDRAEVTPTDKSQWTGKTERPVDRNPTKVKPTESAHGAFEIAVTGDYRYSEERIYVGDPLLVLGEVRTHTFDAADDEVDEADAESAASTAEPKDPDEVESEAEDARNAERLAAAQNVTRVTIGRGSGKQPLILTTTPQAQHIALSEKGGVRGVCRRARAARDRVVAVVGAARVDSHLHGQEAQSTGVPESGRRKHRDGRRCESWRRRRSVPVGHAHDEHPRRRSLLHECSRSRHADSNEESIGARGHGGAPRPNQSRQSDHQRHRRET